MAKYRIVRGTDALKVGTTVEAANLDQALAYESARIMQTFRAGAVEGDPASPHPVVAVYEMVPIDKSIWSDR